jgi:hypothetical protein
VNFRIRRFDKIWWGNFQGSNNIFVIATVSKHDGAPYMDHATQHTAVTEHCQENTNTIQFQSDINKQNITSHKINNQHKAIINISYLVRYPSHLTKIIEYLY